MFVCLRSSGPAWCELLFNFTLVSTHPPLLTSISVPFPSIHSDCSSVDHHHHHQKEVVLLLLLLKHSLSSSQYFALFLLPLLLFTAELLLAVFGGHDDTVFTAFLFTFFLLHRFFSSHLIPGGLLFWGSGPTLLPAVLFSSVCVYFSLPTVVVPCSLFLFMTVMASTTTITITIAWHMTTTTITSTITITISREGVPGKAWRKKKKW